MSIYNVKTKGGHFKSTLDSCKHLKRKKSRFTQQRAWLGYALSIASKFMIRLVPEIS